MGSDTIRWPRPISRNVMPYQPAIAGASAERALAAWPLGGRHTTYRKGTRRDHSCIHGVHGAAGYASMHSICSSLSLYLFHTFVLPPSRLPSPSTSTGERSPSALPRLSPTNVCPSVLLQCATTLESSPPYTFTSRLLCHLNSPSSIFRFTPLPSLHPLPAAHREPRSLFSGPRSSSSIRPGPFLRGCTPSLSPPTSLLTSSQQGLVFEQPRKPVRLCTPLTRCLYDYTSTRPTTTRTLLTRCQSRMAANMRSSDGGPSLTHTLPHPRKWTIAASARTHAYRLRTLRTPRTLPPHTRFRPGNRRTLSKSMRSPGESESRAIGEYSWIAVIS